MKKYKLTYRGNGSPFVFRMHWATGLTLDLDIVIKSFFREYAVESGLNIDNKVQYSHNFRTWFLNKHFPKFQHLFELTEIENQSNKESGKIELNSTVQSSNSLEQAQVKLKQMQQHKTVGKPVDLVIETKHDLIVDKTKEEIKKVKSQKSKVMTGDDTLSAIRHTESIDSSQPKKTKKKETKVSKVVTLDPSANTVSEFKSGNIEKVKATVFDPFQQEKDINSRAKVISDSNTPTLNVNQTEIIDSNESTSSVITPNSVKVALDPTLDAIVRNPDLKEVENIIKNIRDKGLLQKAKVLASNRGDHSRIQVIEDRLRVM